MKVTVKTPAYDDKGQVIMKEIQFDEITIG